MKWHKMAGTTVTFDSDTLLNVAKRRDTFRFATATSEDNVNISYLAGEEIDSNKLMFLNDTSGDLYSNWAIEDAEYEKFTGQTKNLRYYHFLVTDEFVGGDQASIPETPLFYKHQVQKRFSELLNSPADSGIIASDYQILDIQVLNRDLQEYNDPAISYQISDGLVYSNLKNEYDAETGLWDLFFVRYGIKFTRGDGTTASQVYTDLLSQEPIFHLATPDDLNDDLTLKSTADAYTITPEAGWIEIGLPQNTNYAVRPESETKLHLVMPRGLTPDVPWYVSIPNGRVLDLQAGSSYIYDVPEYLTKQTFFPYAPYKYVQNELMTRISKSLYRSVKHPVVIPGVTGGIGSSSSAFHSNIFAYDETGTLREIYTTNGNLLGIKDATYDLRWRSILAIDPSQGIFHLDASFPTNWNLYSTYYYVESNYEMNDIDFNPVTNNDIIGKMIVIYVVPQDDFYWGHSGRDESIYYLVVDKDTGLVTQCSQDGVSDPLNRDLASSVVGYSYDHFLESYSLTGTGGAAVLNRLLILGEITIVPNQQPQSLYIADVRVEGGGLKQSVVNTVLGRS